MCTTRCHNSIKNCMDFIYKGIILIYISLYVFLHVAVTIYVIAIGALKASGFFDDTDLVKSDDASFIIVCISVFLMNLRFILVVVKNLACIKNPKKYGFDFDKTLTHNFIEHTRNVIRIISFIVNIGTIMIIGMFRGAYLGKTKDINLNNQNVVVYSNFIICSFAYSISSLLQNFIGFPIKSDIFTLKSSWRKGESSFCDIRKDSSDDDDDIKFCGQLGYLTLCDEEKGIECCHCCCDPNKNDNVSSNKNTHTNNPLNTQIKNLPNVIVQIQENET